MAYTYEDKLNFIADLYCPARMIADETGCSWQLILGQAAGETGWGEKVLAGTNNVFNIKADKSWTGPSKVFHVNEEINGKTVWVDDPFRVYGSIQESLADRMAFLKRNPRYYRLSESDVKGDYKKEAHELQKARYATDPEYAEKLIEIIEGPTMRRGIARGQKRGCAAVLPVLEVQVLDGAKVPIPSAAVQVEHNRKKAETATDSNGRLLIRALPTGAIYLKVFDKLKEAWVALEPIMLGSGAGKGSTVITPTFNARTSTREHVKTSPPKPAPKPAPKAAAPPREAPSAVKFKSHRVSKGETLGQIGILHGVRYQAIAKANGITSPYIIRPDQILKIPDVAATLAAQEKRQSKAAQPAPLAPAEEKTGTTLGALGDLLAEGASSLHTVYLRNTEAHPQTDLMHASRAPWMAPAEQEFKKGVKRRAGAAHDPRILEYFKATPKLPASLAKKDETAYCAAFVNWCLGRAGYKGNNSAWAADFKKWGRPTRDERPALGAVALIKFPEGGHHVTFVAGLSADGKRIATLGGNQGSAHEVSHSYCPRKWVVAYRYPADYPDYDDDYLLHDVASDHAPMTAAGTR